MNIRLVLTLIFSSSLLLPFISPEVDARGGRGGGFSRGGIASGGGFSGGHASAQRQAGGRDMNRHAGSAQHEQRQQHQQNRQNWNDDRRAEKQDWKDDNREDWQDYGKDRQDDRQDYGKDRQEDRQDFIDDEYDDHWDHHHNDWDDGDFAAGVVVGGVMVGAAAAASRSNQVTYVTTLPCQASEVSVDGATYYKCSSSWYQRAYSGSQVTYIQVAAPSGF